MLWQHNSIGLFCASQIDSRLLFFYPHFGFGSHNVDESLNRYCIIQNAVTIIIQWVLYYPKCSNNKVKVGRSLEKKMLHQVERH